MFPYVSLLLWFPTSQLELNLSLSQTGSAGLETSVGQRGNVMRT